MGKPKIIYVLAYQQTEKLSRSMEYAGKPDKLLKRYNLFTKNKFFRVALLKFTAANEYEVLHCSENGVEVEYRDELTPAASSEENAT